MMKVCGARSPEDIEAVAEASAELVGLWYGVSGGHADLSAPAVTRLAKLACALDGPQPVLVTLLDDVEALRRIVDETGVRWVQLHGYQLPSHVRTLRTSVGHGVTIVKVLHLQGAACPERQLVPAYERAGTDMFLLDAMTPDGRLGSTGQPQADAVVAELADRLSRPFVLAGGISAHNRGRFPASVAHHRFSGLDVDSAARDRGGCLRAHLISAIRDSWLSDTLVPFGAAPSEI